MINFFVKYITAACCIFLSAFPHPVNAQEAPPPPSAATPSKEVGVYRAIDTFKQGVIYLKEAHFKKASVLFLSGIWYAFFYKMPKFFLIELAPHSKKKIWQKASMHHLNLDQSLYELIASKKADHTNGRVYRVFLSNKPLKKKRRDEQVPFVFCKKNESFSQTMARFPVDILNSSQLFVYFETSDFFKDQTVYIKQITIEGFGQHVEIPAFPLTQKIYAHLLNDAFNYIPGIRHNYLLKNSRSEKHFYTHFSVFLGESQDPQKAKLVAPHTEDLTIAQLGIDHLGYTLQKVPTVLYITIQSKCITCFVNKNRRVERLNRDFMRYGHLLLSVTLGVDKTGYLLKNNWKRSDEMSSDTFEQLISTPDYIYATYTYGHDTKYSQLCASVGALLREKEHAFHLLIDQSQETSGRLEQINSQPDAPLFVIYYVDKEQNETETTYTNFLIKQTAKENVLKEYQNWNSLGNFSLKKIDNIYQINQPINSLNLKTTNYKKRLHALINGSSTATTPVESRTAGLTEDALNQIHAVLLVYGS